MAHFYSQNNPYQHDSEIEGVIFDLDSTLYPASLEMDHIQIDAAVVAVQEQMDWDTDTIRKMIALSREEYGGSLNIFAVEHGADMNKLRHDHYQAMKDITTEGFFEPEDAPSEGLSRLRFEKVALAIATHGNHDWTEHALDKLDIAEFFPTANHITKGDVGNIGKNAGTKMYEATLDSLGVPETANPEERGMGYAMIEDTMKNLKAAKEMGMLTILIRPDIEGVDKDEIADYVDVVVKDVHDAIDAVIQSNESHNPHQFTTTHVASLDFEP